MSEDEASQEPRLIEVKETIIQALDGLPKERCAALLAMVAIHYGFYVEAIDLIQSAIKHRDSIFRKDRA